MDSGLPRWYHHVDRGRFLEAVRSATEEAVQGRTHDRERRLAERDAILQTLERFALIERTRGAGPQPPAERK